MDLSTPLTERAPEDGLVRRAVDGDREAFAALYGAHVDVVFGFLRFRVGSGKAEDLTAETFCRAFEAIEGYRSTGAPFRAWLLRIAYHLLVSDARRRSSTEVNLDAADIGVPTSSHDDDVVSALQIHGLMNRLTARQAAVVDLRYLRDLSVVETAAVLDMTEEAVRAASHRALRMMRRLLEEVPDDV